MRWVDSWVIATVFLISCSDFVSASDPDPSQTSDAGMNSSSAADGGAGATTADGGASTTMADPTSSDSVSDSLSSSSSSPNPPSGTTTSAEGSTTDGSVCGNGDKERGEECDDGNENDRDGCSNRCMAASCDDGVLNGDETDIDCGGSCLTSCEVGEGCRATRDCADVVCDLRRHECAEPSCTDGLLNQGELAVDCGAACNTTPTNVIVNGGFEMDTTGWDTVAPEVNAQNAYFHDGSTNHVMEIDLNSNTTSSWTQDFEVSADDIDQVRTLTLQVGDRDGENDTGGLLISIVDPGGMLVPLSGISGAGFDPATGDQIAVDAEQTGSFSSAVVQFTPTMDGMHTLELLEQTEGPGLGDGGGMVVDNVNLSMIACP